MLAGVFLVCLNQASPNFSIKACSTPRSSNASVRGQTWRLGLSRGMDKKFEMSFFIQGFLFSSHGGAWRLDGKNNLGSC